jgi:hypothetical protein
MAAGQPLNQIYNNPMMIRSSDIPFDGTTGTAGTYIRFSSPEHGVVAARQTITDLYNSGKTTITGIVESVDIPSGSRDDDIILVSKAMGIGPNDVIIPEDLDSFTNTFIPAYAKVRGTKGADNYWNDAVLNTGKKLAQIASIREEEIEDIIEDNIAARNNLEEIKTLTTSEGLTDTHQVLRKATSLDDITQNWNFLENKLDRFSNYTYILEFFCVDIIEERKFHASEGFNVEEISSDAWPSNGINKITIAKTGVSTEFNIDGLQVQSIGVGNATNSRNSAGRRNKFNR